MKPIRYLSAKDGLGVRPVNRLAEELKGKVSEVHIIGDAKEPQKVINAITEGSSVARMI